MHPTLRRLLATAAPTARTYLEPGAPTGLTGLLTHPAPRTALLYLYNQTLSRLRTLPPTSAYRQATEALTKHRLAIVENTVPAGHAEWQQKADEILKANPDLFTPARARRLPRTVQGPDAPSKAFQRRMADGRTFVTERLVRADTIADEEWGGFDIKDPSDDGPMPFTEQDQQRMLVDGKKGEEDAALAEWAEDKVAQAWVPEPQLDAEQVSEVEQKLGAGLIEEVIQVAEGELKLVGQMIESKPWEELVEKPSPGQWKYFERSSA